MIGLTKKQQDVLDFILDYIKRCRFSPSFRDIQKFFGFSSLASAHKHVKVLERKGFLTYEKKCSRSLMPSYLPIETNSPTEMEIPFIGHISNEDKIETFPQTQMLPIPACLVRSPEITYVLRAKGSGFADEMIADGDLLIVEARGEAHPKEIVVSFLYSKELVIRQYQPEGNFVRLISLSQKSEAILVKNDDLTIHGILAGALRIYS